MCDQHKTKFQARVFTIVRHFFLYIRHELDKIVDSSSAKTVCYSDSFQYFVAFASKGEC